MKLNEIVKYNMTFFFFILLFYTTKDRSQKCLVQKVVNSQPLPFPHKFFSGYGLDCGSSGYPHPRFITKSYWCYWHTIQIYRFFLQFISYNLTLIGASLNMNNFKYTNSLLIEHKIVGKKIWFCFKNHSDL